MTALYTLKQIGQTLDGATADNFATGNGVFMAANQTAVENSDCSENGWSIPSTQFGGEGILTPGIVSDLTIFKNTCRHNREHGVYISAGTKTVSLTFCHLLNNGDPNRVQGGFGLQVNADGPDWPSLNLTITDNEIAFNVHSGARLNGANQSTFARNCLHDNGGWACMLVTQNQGLTIDKNDIRHPGKVGIVLGPTGSKGSNQSLTLTNNSFYVPAGMPVVVYDQANMPTVSDYNTYYIASASQPIWTIDYATPATTKHLTLAQLQALGLDLHSTIVIGKPPARW